MSPRLLPGLAVVLLAAAPAAAHHGWGGYDSTRTMRFSAPVRAIAFDNPHAEMTVAHEGKTWRIVLAPPSRMVSRGVDPEAIKIGDSVGIEGYPHKSEANEIRAERITVAGKTVELR